MEACPCGSDKNYDDCCEPLITGKKEAESAEALLRSRYTAHVKHEMDYVTSTILPSQLERHDAEAALEWSKTTKWDHLEIIKVNQREEEESPVYIEFKAYYEKFSELKTHHELAKFVKEDGKWYFDDQQDDRREPVRREEPKIGRNDPCNCGSGLKYKKCCGR